MRTLFGVVLLAVTIGTASAQERTIIRMPGSLTGLPFSSAVRVGNLIFLSGQVGVMPGTRTLAPGGAAGQTRQVMENIKAVVEYAGSSMDRMIKCTVFLRHIEDYGAVNEVYATFFGEEPPARSAMAASGLALDALVEIECIALAGAAR